MPPTGPESGSTPVRVLQLVETDDVGVEPGQRGEELVALTSELRRLVEVCAAALDVLQGAAGVVTRVAGRVVRREEEVERVHRRDPHVPPTGSGAVGRGLVAVYVAGPVG